jgi:hypothetical protein
MREIVELHEQIDEVNYFVREWRSLAGLDTPNAKIFRKPEIRFVARALERVVQEANSLNIHVVLKVGEGMNHDAHTEAAHSNTWPQLKPHSIIRLTDYQVLTDANGDKISYIGNKHALLSFGHFTDIIAGGGELSIAGPHEGDWNM